MSREWKRGEVGVHTTYGYRSIFVPSCPVHERDCWHNESGMSDSSDDPRRPLAVIDPEDREQVERFCEIASRWADGVPYEDMREQGDMDHADAMKYALREFANPKPPKPDEPMGLGAVVRDNGSRAVWTAIAAMGGVDRWSCPNGERREWADLPCQITILSPGWEADQ